MERQKRSGDYFSVDGISKVSSSSSRFYIDGISQATYKPRPTINKIPPSNSQAPLQPITKLETSQNTRANFQASTLTKIDRLSPQNEALPRTSPALASTMARPLLPSIGMPPVANPQNRASLIGTALPIHRYRTSHKSSKANWRPKRIIKTAAIAITLSVVGIGGWFGANLLGNVNKVFHGNVFSDAHALISGSSLKESGGRINILLAGDSVDDPGHNGATLADSIMVISFNPKTKTGFILSVPRDLWVYIPSMGHQKINAANVVSRFNETGYPSGGMGQLQQIVQTDLGIPIDYEALIDYSAFKDAVNAVGGITINIQSPDPRGLYDAYTHLKLPNGEVALTGAEALNLARARGDGSAGDVSYGFPSSDFTRTMYQRKMLEALFTKASSVGVLSNPIKVTSLFNAFGNNVQTNLSLGDVLSLISATSGLNLNNLQSESYSYGGTKPLIIGYTDPKSGEEALIPTLGIDNFSQLRAFYQQLTSSNPVVQEAPTVTLLNASDVSGLASREAKVLEGQGFNVVSMADASSVYPTSLIVDSSSGLKPASISLLKSDITGSVTNSLSTDAESKEATNYSSNFVVIMGQNWDKTTATGNLIQ